MQKSRPIGGDFEPIFVQCSHISACAQTAGALHFSALKAAIAILSGAFIHFPCAVQGKDRKTCSQA